MLLYDELADWWPLLSPPSHYGEEAAFYLTTLRRAAARPLRTLLELGSGGGNVASHLAPHLALTLSDLSPAMLAVSRRLNAGCEHVVGDMRDLRLGRSFDAVLAQDAIMHMTTSADLLRALRTARAHLEPGGVALFAPDHTRESWTAGRCHGGEDDGARALVYEQEEWDEDPRDEAIDVRFLLRLRDGPPGSPIAIRTEVQRWGLFPQARWIALLEGAGFEAHALPYVHSTFSPQSPRCLFVGVAQRQAAEASG